MKSVFVVAVIFIAGTFAEVPLSKFKNHEYELTAPNDDFFKVFQEFGLDISFLTHEKMFTLHTPDAEGGEYSIKWASEDSIPLSVEFTNGETNEGKVGKETASYHYAVGDDKIVLTIKLGKKILTETVAFTDDQVTETAKFGDHEVTRVYKLKKKN